MTHPFLSRSLPILFDDFVDIEFGTGEQGPVLLWERKEPTSRTPLSIFPLKEKKGRIPGTGRTWVSSQRPVLGKWGTGGLGAMCMWEGSLLSPSLVALEPPHTPQVP